MGLVRVLVVLTTVVVGSLGAFHDHTCADDRTVIVHLFNWLWTDIERECVEYLGPKGFCGVQVSPPNEHRVVKAGSDDRPWWERYQPISYILGSRSGSREEFVSMVRTCNSVNVRIYVDMVVNHMCGIDGSSGTGSWGSWYDTGALSFPAVPYGPNDFNCCNCGMCSSSNCGIDSYNDVNQVRNCRLVGLGDLALGDTYVQQKIADFFNDLIDIGVAGFRVDACKHMWPGDMKSVYAKVSQLNTEFFPAGTDAFVFNEVIDLGGEPIKGSEYYSQGLGRITEFKYCNHIAGAFRRYFPLANMENFGESWGMYPSQYALVFVDNHDNQRGHGAGGETILTFYEPRMYKMADAFKMAWPYGHVRIMSSYRWPGGRMDNDGEGPPRIGDAIKPVEIQSNAGCDDGSEHTWVCEHRWRQIANMARWRNLAGGEYWNVQNWWDNGGHQIAFSRGGSAFIAFNNEPSNNMAVTLQTGMQSGSYCDIISGDISSDGNSCTGTVVEVDGSGKTFISLSASSDDPFLAIHAMSRLGTVSPTSEPGTTLPPGSTTPPPEGVSRTIVFIKAQSQPGQDGFLRGGISHEQRTGCVDNAETSACALDIRHNSPGSGEHYAKYTAWSVGDTKLDWYGAQSGQGSASGQAALGTPMVWTTNDPSSDGYQELNKWGDHYWMSDFNMDCDQTESGWFEVKMIASNYFPNGGWEGDINQSTCTGSVGGSPGYTSNNHMARCGFVNVFQFNYNACEISSI